MKCAAIFLHVRTYCERHSFLRKDIKELKQKLVVDFRKEQKKNHKQFLYNS
jgi:hypothetical protein